MRMAKKAIAILMLLPILAITLFGCISVEDYKSEYIYYWNGNEYSLYDSFGNHIESQWQFPFKDKSDTSIVRIFFGPANDVEKKPNTIVKKFNDPTLDMLLIEWGDLLCKKDYLPNYHEVKEVEDIYIVKRAANYDVDFFGSKASHLGDKEKVNAVYKELVYASETKNWYSNSSPELENQYEFGEVHIGLKFFDVVAIYDIGYINRTENGKWGLYLYDKQPYELYLLNTETVQLLF